MGGGKEGVGGGERGEGEGEAKEGTGRWRLGSTSGRGVSDKKTKQKGLAVKNSNREIDKPPLLWHHEAGLIGLSANDTHLIWSRYLTG